MSLSYYFIVYSVALSCGLFGRTNTVIAKYETLSKTYPGGSNSGNGQQQQQQQWVRASGYNESKSYNYGADETSSPSSSNAAILSTKERLQRLGYTTGYGGLNGYSSGNGLTGYNPIKLDLGGVVLGTLVGIGAILIIPKLLNALQGGYTGYGRSDMDSAHLSTLGNIINKIDDILVQNNIDSTSCVQRVVCSYVRSSENNLQLGVSDQIDDLIHLLTENSVVDYLLDGTAIEKALKYGKDTNSKSCEELYSSCPLDSKMINNVIFKLLPSKHKNILPNHQ